MTEQHMVQLLQRRGVTVDQISEIVFKLQKPYNDQLSHEECTESVHGCSCEAGSAVYALYGHCA